MESCDLGGAFCVYRLHLHLRFLRAGASGDRVSRSAYSSMAVGPLSSCGRGSLRMGAALGNRLADRASTPAPRRASFFECFPGDVDSDGFLFMAVPLMGPRDALGSPAFLLYFFFILLSILQLDARLCLFTGLVAAVEHFLLAYVVIGTLEPDAQTSFWRMPVFHFNRSLVLFGAGLVAGLLARQIKRQAEVSLHTVQDRDRAVRIFGQYVSPQIAEKLLHQPVALGGELRNVCVMFLDIRDFSSYAACQRPDAVMAYLNSLFDVMIDVVNEHQGIVNKFLGDGFMAVFGAPIADPRRCDHAVGVSLAILDRLKELNAAGKIHPTRVGIGLHMGEAVTGNVGST